MANSSERPNWWTVNEHLRERMELPEYRPPRFIDGVYTHKIVPELEDQFDVTLRFVGFDSQYPDDWNVVADNACLFEIGRHRDGNGNTVYELMASEFEEYVIENLKES